MDYRSIMDGRRRDPLAVFLRAAGRLAAVPYQTAVRVRNWRYDTGRATVHRAGVPVVSIGNLTAGGTGKTPMVCWIARWLRDQDVRVSIVSRGYRAGEHGVNDEALELEQRLPDVPHLQNPDRVEAARVAVEELETELILLDDGFQHRRLHRDLDIVLIDATCPFGYGHLLPRGLLREPLGSICRADVAVITRADAVAAEDLHAIAERLRREHADLPIAEAVHAPLGLVDAGGHRGPIETLSGSRVAAVCGIGNPEAFFETVRRCGATVVATRSFADHFPFDRASVAELAEWIASLESIDRVVCTHKDLVKLQIDRLAGVPLEALQIEIALRHGREALVSRLAEIARRP